MMKMICLAMMLLNVSAFAMPLTDLTDLDGRPAKEMHEKNIELVVLWATWCSDCKAKLKGELPMLNRSDDVAVVAVNTETDVERVKHFLSKESISLPVILDPLRTLRKELKAFSVPHWAVYKRATKSAPWKLIDTAPAFESDRVERALGRKVTG